VEVNDESSPRGARRTLVLPQIKAASAQRRSISRFSDSVAVHAMTRSSPSWNVGVVRCDPRAGVMPSLEQFCERLGLTPETSWALAAQRRTHDPEVAPD
jgi:hypothetical protein